MIGIRDFFAMVVPGALLLFILRDFMPLYVQLGSKGFDIFAFAVGAYIVGATALGIGSTLDMPVDFALQSGQFRLYLGKGLAKRERLAEELRSNLLADCPRPFQDNKESETTKAFWRNFLRLNSVAAINELDRLEALQKMYRTLVAVFAFLLFYEIYSQINLQDNMIPDLPIGNAVIWLILTLVSFVYYAGSRWRYVDSVYSLAISFCVKK